MGSIYLLQKYVDGLGLVIKIGMTFRSADQRASEYGGGGWDCISEYTVATEDRDELRAIESDIHDELEVYSCLTAKDFGLKEVFHCEPDTAIAVIEEILGGETSLQNAPDAKQKKVTRNLVKNLEKRYEKDILDVARDGTYNVGPKGSEYLDVYRAMKLEEKDIALLSLHDHYLQMLSDVNGSNSDFKHLVEKQRDLVYLRLEEARFQSEQELSKREQQRQLEAQELKRTLEEKAARFGDPDETLLNDGEKEYSIGIDYSESRRSNLPSPTQPAEPSGSTSQAKSDDTQQERGGIERQPFWTIWRLVFWAIFLIWAIGSAIRYSHV